LRNARHRRAGEVEGLVEYKATGLAGHETQVAPGDEVRADSLSGTTRF